MAVDKYPYIDIDDTLGQLMNQTYESLEYAAEVCPRFSRPEKLYNWLKFNTTFQSDPPKTELLQTMQTLFEHNYHGNPGAGDCDCFVIATIACMKVNGWDDIAIILCGRNRKTPIHIYTAVLDNGKWQAFDLTNTFYGEERTYPFRQTLRI